MAISKLILGCYVFSLLLPWDNVQASEPKGSLVSFAIPRKWADNSAQGSTGHAQGASITPAGELIAFASRNAVAVIETTDGKLAGCIQR